MDEINYSKSKDHLFSLIYQNFLDEVYIFNPLTWEIKEVNKTALENIGYSEDEIHNKTYFELLSNITLSQFTEILEPLIEGNQERIVFESNHKRKDNSTYPVEITFQIIFNIRKYIIAYVRNIKEKKQLEKQLQQEKEYLNYVIEATETGTWKWNIKSGETEYNEQWANMLGYTLLELAPVNENTWRKLVHPDDLKKSDILVNKHFNKEIPMYHCEVRMRQKDGSYKWIEDKGKVVSWGEDGKPLLMYGVHIDINERKKIELELIESQQLFQNLTESSLISIALFQKNHCIYANPSFMKITGFELHELMKMDINSIISDNYKEEINKILGEISNKKTKSFTFMIKDKNGENKWVLGTFVKVIVNSKSSILFSFNDISELMKAEKEIEESHEKLQNLIDSANVGTWIWNVKTNETIYNETWANLLGYTLDELQPISLKTWENLTDPDDIKKTYIELDKHFNGETKFYECEIRMRHKNDQWIWILDKGKVITRDEKGKPLLMFGIHADITRLKNIEIKLIENNKFLELILNTIPSRVFWKDKNMIYLGCNNLFARDLGLESKDLIKNKTDFDINTDEDALIYREEDKYIIETKKPLLNLQQIAPVPGGNKIWTRKHKVPIFDENGEVIGILGTYEDITKLKEKERQLIEEKERLNVLIQSIGDGVIAIDSLKNIVLINKVAQELTGFSESDALGKKLEYVFNVIDELNEQPILDPVQKVFETKKICKIGGNPLLIAKNGKKYIIEDSISPILKENEEILGAVLVFRDITEKLKLLTQTQNAAKLDSLSMLSSGIAHDFNNLLSGIYGFIDLALNDYDSTSIKENLLMALNTLERAKSLSNQLITFSKGGKPILKEEDLNDIIFPMTKFALAGSNIEAIFNIEKDLNNIICDKNMISQVIENLIINARQAMENGGKIYIDAKNVDNLENKIMNLTSKEYVCIKIRDEGIGIEPELLKNIFDPFFTTKKDGKGLGLAVSYSIIKQHNGHIEVDSKPKVGTEFTIYLPAMKRDKTKEASLYKENFMKQDKDDIINKTNTDNKKIKKILIMDDELAILKSTSKYLIKNGFVVDESTTGEMALELYYKSIDKKDRYDLLILDLTVQTGMGGKELMEKIRKEDKDILSIVCSGYSEDPILVEPEKYGFNSSIQKPFFLGDLLKIILSLQKNN